MIKKYKNILMMAGLLLMLALTACGPKKPVTSNTPAAGTGGPKRILVIETTDIHGWLLDASSGDMASFKYRMAYIAKAVSDARKSGKYDDVILLDGGDQYQGPPVSNLCYGAALRAAMDIMKYDAVALGNHEFDWEVTKYAADDKGTVAPYEIGEYRGDPDIPVLAANLYYSENRARVPFTKDYVILEKAGLKVAVVGYIPDYSSSVMAKKIAPYYIDESVAKLKTLIERVKKTENPDITIVLAHDEARGLAESLGSGTADLVLGGHSHIYDTGKTGGGVSYLQARCYAQGYATAVITVNDGDVSVGELKYVDITAKPDALTDKEANLKNFDETILDLSYVAWNAAWEQMSEVLGYIDTPVRKTNDVGANSAGNWLTGLLLEGTKEKGAVAAFYNNGGIRTNLTIPSGESIRQITVNDIYTIAPFGNTVLLYDITGRELAKQLANALAHSNHGDQVSGLKYTYTATGNASTPREDRVYTIVSITLDDGREVDVNDDKTIYRVCITNYSSTLSGSVFERKTPVFPESESPADHELLTETLRKLRDAGDGHISVDTGERGREVKP